MGKRAVGVAAATAATDTLVWSNLAGGAWSATANWQDTTTGAAATAAPGAGNAVVVAGAAGHPVNLTGNGAAASLAVSGGVLLWGTVAVGGAITLTPGADLELDGAASLTSASLSGVAATLEIGMGDTLAVAGGGSLSGGLLVNVAGGAMQFGALALGAGETALFDDTATLAVAGALTLTGALSLADGSAARAGGLVLGGAAALSVDATSVLEVGGAGGAAAGALTIDKGIAAAAAGAIQGNVVVAGTLAVVGGGTLAIDAGRATASIGGAGTLAISESATLLLGAADTAAIRFTGPGGTLALATPAAGPISGFVAGDGIAIGALATAIAFTQSGTVGGTLALIRAGRTVGTLGLLGNFTGAQFHLTLGVVGGTLAGTITLQSPGAAPQQRGTITGTAGADILTATANAQVLTGLGGGDTVNAAGFSGVVFRDTSANLSGSVIQGFAAGDVIDATDLTSGSLTVSYAGGALVATDGTHALTVALSGTLPSGYFVTGADGAGGATIGYVAVNTDALSFNASLGGSLATATNWLDLATGAAATQPPGYGNALSVAGGSAYLTLTGATSAASLATSGDVLLWGSLALGAKVAGASGNLTQSGTLALDAGASLALSGTVWVGGVLELGGGSALSAGAIAFDSAAALELVGGAAVTLGTVGPIGAAGTIMVDPTSSLTIGAASAATAGALVIGAGQTVDLAGQIDATLVVAGTLIAGANAGATFGLAIAGFPGATGTISGGGAILVTAGTTLALAEACTVPITLQSGATLALSGPLPTGAIGGFGVGAAITVMQPVTALGWAQTSTGGGVLTLYAGAAAIGTLGLTGAYSAGNFVASTSAAGITTIIGAPAPVAGVGAQVSGSTDSFRWIAGCGGDWSLAANWTDNGAGARAAPGAAASVAFDDPVTGAQIVTGTGAAGSLAVYDATIFAGTLAVSGTATVATGGAAWVQPGATLSATGLSDIGAIKVTGALNVAGVAGIGGVLSVVGGGVAQISGAAAASTIAASGLVAVDALSSLEFGGAGGAAAGTLTVDRGLALRDGGLIAANMLVNGAVFGTGGTITGFGGSVGSIGGSGSLEIDAGGRLVLNAADSAAILMTGGGGAAGSVLELRGPLPTAAISGFVQGDLIVFDQTVTGVQVAQIAAGRTTLALTNGATSVGTLTLTGSYTQGVFTVAVAPGTGFGTLSLQGTGAGGGAGGGPGGAGTTVIGNAARIAGATSANTYAVIAANLNYASLGISGRVLLTGNDAIAGQVSLGAGGALTLARGGSLAAASLALAGSLEVAQAGTLAITNGMTMNNAQLLALGGSFVRVRGLVGNAGTLAIDASSTIDFGTIAAPVAGALNLSAPAVGALSGTVFGSLVNPGLLVVPGGGALYFDMVGTSECDPFAGSPSLTGSGLLQIAEGATLGIGVADSVSIQFIGPAGTLALAALPTATIRSFAPGDAIVIERPVTGLSAVVGGGATTLSLTSGTVSLGTLTLATTPASGQKFHLDVAPDGGSGTITLQSVGIATTQPLFIPGSVGADLLYATGNGQTLTGSGGGDTFDGRIFTGLDFKDLAANLNGATIVNFAPSDLLDFTDLAPAKASVSYTGGVLSITDNATPPHAATLSLGFASQPTSGSFHVGADAGAGTSLRWF